MSKEHSIKLQCTACETVNYFEQKNAHIKNRLEKSKFCGALCKKHTPHKETK
jgi:ribosomal protein L33